MRDVAPAPDLALLLGPGDEAEFVALADWPARAGRTERSWLYVVLHRGHGLWSHAYRVVPDRRPGHLAVFLERAEEGDRRAELAAWLRGRASAGGRG
ncbi:hypothetical protein GXW77_14195 [Roseomonas alkaliterrae]|uniref:Uncharacterized protein n=1 Tax=Neoroseomonas alkaliterrae TaxID=1452450 RepID=A0A840XRH5_9PROT|nr:hypothetical protein [Neoroseomonas alkaliterrae]MBB5690526.1 hypothetical protein [Neoroseomonas alkaliterrae]MBR0677327.1 hypothetical protein [Neoroseomonas alkaliterrae]